MTMNFKEALIAHLQGEKVEVYSRFSAYDGECEQWRWRKFGKYYSALELRNISLRNASEDIKYRLAPRAIIVNGVEVPAPEKEAPMVGVTYYTPDFTESIQYFKFTWGGDEIDMRLLERGLVYLRKEDAIARAKAMLITKEA